MKIEEMKYRFSLVVIAAFFIMAIGYPLYKSYVKSRPEVRFTVCTIVEMYVSSKDVGKRFRYSVGGEEYLGICTSKKCIEAGIGSRYLLKYYLDHPGWTEIFWDKKIKDGIEAPFHGWESMP